MLDTSASGGSKHAVVALGNFPTAEAAARAHDLALRCAVGDAAHTNFSVAELHVEDEVELEDGTVLHGVCRSGGAGSGCGWRACLVYGSKQRHVGYFTSAKRAAAAYDVAAAYYFGKNARLNFPDGPPSLLSDEEDEQEGGGKDCRLPCLQVV